LKCAPQLKIAKNKKTLILEVQGLSVIDVEKTKKLVIIVLVVIGSMSMLSATVFMKDWPTAVKMTFTGVTLFDALVRRFP